MIYDPPEQSAVDDYQDTLLPALEAKGSELLKAAETDETAKEIVKLYTLTRMKFDVPTYTLLKKTFAKYQESQAA